MTYEVLWSGSLERQGLCPSLSGYRGSSTLMPVLDRPIGADDPHMTPAEREHRRLYMQQHRRALKRRGQLAITWD